MSEAFVVSAELLKLRPYAAFSGGLTIRCGDARRFVPWPVVEQLTPGELGRAVAAVARAGGVRELWILNSRPHVVVSVEPHARAWTGMAPGLA